MRWTAKDLRSLAVGLAYLSPALFIFVVFVFIPLGRTFYISLFNNRSTGVLTTFNGLDHYIDLITSATFRSSLVAYRVVRPLHRADRIALGLILACCSTSACGGSASSDDDGEHDRDLGRGRSLIWLLLFNPSLGLLNYVLSWSAFADRSG